MAGWKDQDIATLEMIEEYLQEFREGIFSNSQYQLMESEQDKVNKALDATHRFCTGLLGGKAKKLYMHDLILMAIGFYGGYLTALTPGTIDHHSNAVNQNLS